MTIEGVDEVMKLFEKFPIKADKVVKEAMREASKAVAKNIRAKMPNKTFRKAVRYKIAEGEKYTFANVGILRPKKEGDYGMRNGKKIPSPWMRAYWKNFGTLSNRDPMHKFIYKRKKVSAGWKGGIKPTHFFERAIEGEEMTWKKKFEDSLRQKAKERKLLDEK